MDFTEVIQKRASVRKFQPVEISDEALLRICEAGRLAPSGCNLQNREFIIIRDRQTLDALDAEVQPGCCATASAAIALVIDPGPTPFGAYWKEDAAAAAQCMLLAIVNEGLASVWIEGTLLRKEEWAKELLNVPGEKRLFILLPIGKEKDKIKHPPKAELETIVHYEKY